MPVAVAAKPKDIRDYYAALDAYAEQGVTHEGAVRLAFQHLLAGIPADVFAYRLGNRSALEWVIDQGTASRPDGTQSASAPTPTGATDDARRTSETASLAEVVKKSQPGNG